MNILAMIAALNLTERQLKREAQQRITAHIEKYAPLMHAKFMEHMPALARMRRDLVYKDKYGHIIFDDWYDELDYFLEKSLPGVFDGGFEWPTESIARSFLDAYDEWKHHNP